MAVGPHPARPVGRAVPLPQGERDGCLRRTLELCFPSSPGRDGRGEVVRALSPARRADSSPLGRRAIYSWRMSHSASHGRNGLRPYSSRDVRMAFAAIRRLRHPSPLEGEGQVAPPRTTRVRASSYAGSNASASRSMIAAANRSKKRSNSALPRSFAVSSVAALTIQIPRLMRSDAR